MLLPIRLSPTGPEGWRGLPDQTQETATLVAGLPEGRDHAYVRREAAKYRIGIWRSQAYSEWYDSYAADEFMVVLDGAVTLEAEGFSQTYVKGDAFFVPKGFQGYWRQAVPMLKYYVIFE